MALELASRELGLDKPSQQPSRRRYTQPEARPRRHGSRPRALEHGLGIPRTIRRRGCVTRTAKPVFGPTSLRARNPPRTHADKPPQSRGHRGRAPSWMAVTIVRDAYSTRAPRTQGPTNIRHHHPRADGPTAAPVDRPQPTFGTRYPTQSTARGPRTSPGPAQPGTRRELPSPHQFRTDHEQASDSD